MIDTLGRTIDYIRISITDRCNLRCVYCMPEEGMPPIAHEEILTFEEIVRICKLLAKHGFKKIKLTGGEPLVRKDVDVLIKKLKSIEGITNVTLTTNGVLLSEYYNKLVDAGIDGITISLDTINEMRYKEIARRDSLGKVLEGIKLAQEKGKVPLKINCVILKDEKEEDIISLLKFAENNETDVRFIEMMPIGYGNNFEFVSDNYIRTLIENKYGQLIPYYEKRGNGPSEYYEVSGLKGKIGFISSISHKFCDSCNRIRLTADGNIKTCLQYNCNVNLKKVLKQEITDDELWLLLEEVIKNKPAGHHFSDKTLEKTDEKRAMSQIGG